MDPQEAVRRGAEAGLREAAERILEAAKRDIPVGDPEEDPDAHVRLAASGHIETEPGGTVVVSFDTPYAAKQHEDQRLHHPRGGGPKYLERNVLAIVPKLEGIVASEVRKLMSGGR